MARYQWFDAETQTMTVILIPKDGPCYISTRRGGRLAHAGRISRSGAERAVRNYGFQQVDDGDTYHRSRRVVHPATDEEFMVAAHEALAQYSAAVRRLARC